MMNFEGKESRGPAETGDAATTDLIPNVDAGTLFERTLLADDRAVRVDAIH